MRNGFKCEENLTLFLCMKLPTTVKSQTKTNSRVHHWGGNDF